MEFDYQAFNLACRIVYDESGITRTIDDIDSTDNKKRESIESFLINRGIERNRIEGIRAIVEAAHYDGIELRGHYPIDD